MIERPAEHQNQPTYRVLIVDDNEAIHRDFRSLLEARPDARDLSDLAMEIFGEEPDPAPALNLPRYAFDSAYQGNAALETVRKASNTGQSYALAFIDVRMPPGWDGVETIQRIWEVDPNIQMVICSAYSDYSWDELVQELGATDKLLFLRKPFDANSVKQMALSVVCRWSRDQANREHIARLEHVLESRKHELEAARAELDRLTAEIADLRAADGALRGERAARIGDELRRVIDALEDLARTPLSAEQMRVVDTALSAGRALLDEISHELTT